MIKKGFFTAILLLPVIFSCAQTRITTGVTQGRDYGIVYTLPKTTIEIEVQTKKESFTPGEFSRYAERYLHQTEVTTDNKEEWSIESVTVRSVGIPDKDKTYFIKMNDRSVAPLMELSEEGVVVSINRPFSPVVQKEEKVITQKKRINPRDYLTEEILLANSTAKMAELVAQEIYNIRESRNILLRGQADYMPKDGEQLKLMLSKMEEQEEAMTQMFTGTKSIETKNFRFRLDPSEELNGKVAFRFSTKLGVVDSDDLSGEPIYINLTNLQSVPITEAKGKPKSNGVAYNVPGKGRVILTYLGKELVSSDLPITQFGVMEYLAPTLFNRRSTIQVQFNPNTGGIIKVDREEN
ncbi:MAG: DUF4831 family protein [Bacteroides sp.]|nr:DUF4831 family protein [Bacteroides sp.]MDD4720476.1 DUF4831 family protein [Bacteroides sp.]NLI64143.1 DUF4831 family protein [Bacteroidales bacterium]